MFDLKRFFNGLCAFIKFVFRRRRFSDPFPSPLRPIFLTPSSIPLSAALLATLPHPAEPTPSPLSVAPLTPLGKCHLAPLSDCPYAEPWPNRDRLNKSKLPSSPLRISMYQNSTASPPPTAWRPLPHVWTSTPCKPDKHPPPGPAVSPFDNRHINIEVSKALLSRSRCSLRPYDDASNSSISVDDTDVSLPRPTCYPRLSRSRHQFQSYPDFCRLPGKPNRNSAAHGGAFSLHVRSRSHANVAFTTAGWKDSDPFEFPPSPSPSPSPSSGVPALSPPYRSESDDDDDDDDDSSVPLTRIKERLTSWGHLEAKEWEQQYNWLDVSMPPLWASAEQRDSKASSSRDRLKESL